MYDPGHFAVRGSILDIYGYSSEEPFRIDFFGDEIESIRAFNIETQLSERKLDSIAVTSNVAQQSSGSLLTYLKDNSTIWVRDADYTVERIKAIAADSFSDSALIADEGDSEAMKQVIDPEEFATALSRHRLVHFTAAADNPDGESATAIGFGCTPQGIYHKNFDLISDSFAKFLADGYKIYILSDSEKQIERLRAIFEDRGDDIRFTPVISTIHEGFVDHATKNMRVHRPPDI